MAMTEQNRAVSASQRSNAEWTPANVEKLRELAKTHRIIDLARELNVSRSAIIGKCHRLGIIAVGARPDRRNPKPNSRQYKILEMVKAGKSADDIKLAYPDVPPVSLRGQIHRARRELGIEIPPRVKSVQPRPAAKPAAPRSRKPAASARFSFGSQSAERSPVRIPPDKGARSVLKRWPKPASEQALSFLSRKEGQCAMPLWCDDTAMKDRKVCGKTVATRRDAKAGQIRILPYCDACAVAAYQPHHESSIRKSNEVSQ